MNERWQWFLLDAQRWIVLVLLLVQYAIGFAAGWTTRKAREGSQK